MSFGMFAIEDSSEAKTQRFSIRSRGLRKSFGNKFLIGIIILLFCLAACCLSLTIWLYMSIFDELGGTLDVTTIQNNETIITTVFQRLAVSFSFLGLF